jgi:mRNA-degrading endonuclease toxin of MazEF toxin-antitoxin module
MARRPADRPELCNEIDSVASFDILQPIRRSFLTDRVGSLAIDEAGEICRALHALADC